MEQNINVIFKKHESGRCLDFYAEVPCPMKQQLRTAYDQFERENFAKTGEKLYSFVPTNCPSSISPENSIRNIKDAKTMDEIPDVTIAFGMEDFITPNILENYVKQGCFAKINDVSTLPFLHSEEFRDPFNCFNTIGMFPEVMLVDKKVLGNRPVPDSWEALLDPVYRDCIAIPDGHEAVDGALMAYLYQHYGDGGLDRFEANIHISHGGASSARLVGTGRSDGAGVYILPWIFAQGAVKKGQAEVVWPKEGALVEPIVAMVKKDCMPRHKALVDFVLSPEMASVFSDNYFLSAMPGASNPIPEGGTVTWLGWDYVCSHDIGELYRMVTERFSAFHRNK
ncbi:MAG: ABC transporter substrate-binding protein [Oscillospiraceae bacterium]